MPDIATEIENRAAELAARGFFVELSRCRDGWHCQLRNLKLGFWPGGSGATAAEAIESAAKHPLVSEE